MGGKMQQPANKVDFIITGNLKKFLSSLIIFVFLSCQADILFATDRSLPGTNNQYSSSTFNVVPTFNTINTITKNDFDKLIKTFSGTTGCDFNASMRSLNDELIIKLLGYEFIKDGIPKTTSSAQNKFYELALQTNSIASNEDKNTILRVLFNDSCVITDFS